MRVGPARGAQWRRGRDTRTDMKGWRNRRREVNYHFATDGSCGPVLGLVGSHSGESPMGRCMGLASPVLGEPESNLRGADLGVSPAWNSEPVTTIIEMHMPSWISSFSFFSFS